MKRSQNVPAVLLKLKNAFGFSILINIWVSWYYYTDFNIMYLKKKKEKGKNPQSP